MYVTSPFNRLTALEIISGRIDPIVQLSSGVEKRESSLEALSIRSVFFFFQHTCFPIQSF